MSQQAERSDEVVEIVDYLRDTIAGIDQAVEGWVMKRQELALRLAALDASKDSAVLAAVSDYEARVVEQRPYEDAENAEDLLSEAHRKFGM